MPTAAAREVMSVPRDALVLRREGAFVYRIKEDMTAEQVRVVTGLGAGSFIEVIGDVKSGDLVVIRGAERLSTGMTVSIQEGDGADSASNTAASQ
jgi:multidrug efflux pump subunit AcrA (membrane-fusion protein)